MVGKLIAGETIGKLAQNKYTPWIIGGVVLGSLALAYFGVVRPLFCKFDILDCGEDDAEKRLMNLNAFNPNLANKTNTSITHDRAKELAEIIYDGFGFFNDDEEAVYGAIKSAGSVYNMSLVSRMYQAKYKEDLGSAIADSFNQEEMDKVTSIILNYRK